MNIENCTNCGGTHYGSIKCPYICEKCGKDIRIAAEQFGKEKCACVITPHVDESVEPSFRCEGWFIPASSMSKLSQETFHEMIGVVQHGGQVDVVARCDGKDYRWQCDGLKYAKLTFQAAANGMRTEHPLDKEEYVQIFMQQYLTFFCRRILPELIAQKPKHEENGDVTIAQFALSQEVADEARYKYIYPIIEAIQQDVLTKIRGGGK